MPIINGVIGFRASGSSGTALLGEPPTVEVLSPTVAVEAATPLVVVDPETGTVEVTAL